MSTSDTELSKTTEAPLPQGGPWRYAGICAVLVIMGLAFAGYLSPGMRVQWANFMALCGF
jgi:hypothetical protein